MMTLEFMTDPISSGLWLFLAFLSIMQLLRAFPKTGPLVQSLSVIVQDVMPLLVIQMLIVLTFTLFYEAALPKEATKSLFDNFGRMMKTGLFAEDPDAAAFAQSERPEIMYAMHTVFIFLCYIVTLNALIALMGHQVLGTFSGNSDNPCRVIT
jgi:hypothetical protein